VGLDGQTENQTHASEENSATRGLQRTDNDMESERSDLSESAGLESLKQMCQSRRKELDEQKVLESSYHGRRDF
jgi:hypothetical protein